MPSDGAWSRRRLVCSLLAVPVGAVALAACGSDSDGATADEPSATIAPVTDPVNADDPADDGASGDGDDVVDAAYEVPADGAVLEIGYYGGFTPFEVGFQSAPALLVTADGRVIRPAPVAAVFPGPLLPQHTVAELSPAGLQLLLAEIDASGLLAEVDYTVDSLVADAATTTVIVRTGDDEFTHSAYALGLDPGLDDDGGDETPERQALADAVDQLTQIDAIVGDELGDEQPWDPEGYQLLAQETEPFAGDELEPRVVEWPADSGIVLADTAECVEVPRSALGTVLDDADQLTFFTENGTIYQVIARPAYPGRSC